MVACNSESPLEAAAASCAEPPLLVWSSHPGTPTSQNTGRMLTLAVRGEKVPASGTQLSVYEVWAVIPDDSRATTHSEPRHTEPLAHVGEADEQLPETAPEEVVFHTPAAPPAPSPLLPRTVHEATPVAFHATLVFSPTWTSEGATLSVPAPAGGGMHAPLAQLYPA